MGRVVNPLKHLTSLLYFSNSKHSKGVQTVARKYFPRFFHVKKIEFTKLFRLSILFILKQLIVWNIKENNEPFLI